MCLPNYRKLESAKLTKACLMTTHNATTTTTANAIISTPVRHLFGNAQVVNVIHAKPATPSTYY
jgi:hypothetical protein